MSEYKKERNQDKWLIGVVIFILIGTGFLVTKAVIIITSESDKQKQSYKSGYHDARLIYECDHDRSECEMLNENY